MALAWLLILCLTGAPVWAAQEEAQPAPDMGAEVQADPEPGTDDPPALPHSAMPLAEAIVEADAQLSAQRTTAWRDGEQVRYLLLERDVRFELGVYGFEASRAVVRIVIEPRPGRPVRHLALYLEEPRPLGGHGPVVAEGPRLLVTGSTVGGVTLETDRLDRDEEPPEVEAARELVDAALERMHRRDRRLARPTLPMPEEPLFGPEVWQRRDAQRRRVGVPPMLRAEPAVPSDLAPDEAEPETIPPAPAAPPAPEVEPTPAPEIAPGAGGNSDTDNPTAAPANPTPNPNPNPNPAPEPEADANPDTAAQHAEVRDDPDPPASPPGAAAVLPTSGTVRLAADRIVFERTDEESYLMLIGNVRLFFDDDAHDRQVTLQTERAVVFLPGREEDQREPGQTIDARSVRGVYLEDNAVITDGDYTVRAPRIFYDPTVDQAILLEAVAYTQSIEHDLPIYMRANVVRQTSRHSFEARRALITTTSLAEPYFAIGARRLTFEERQIDEERSRAWVTARNATFRLGPAPVFYWPYVTAPAERPPIRSASVGYSDHTGVEVRTRWDLLALTGQREREHLDAAIDLDYRGHHNAGLGLSVDYDPEPMVGEFDGYVLPYDKGTDRLGGRRNIDRDGETRGFARWTHRHDIVEDWELRLEGAYVSDETFLDTFFRDETVTRPYETSAYLKKQEGDWQIDLLAKTNVNDFTPQLTELQTPGHQVEKTPELGYYRIGTSFWRDRLTWYSENRFSRVRADFGEDAPIDRGFTAPASQELFGLDRETTFREAADDVGFPDDARLRFDTRQEIAAPLRAGPLDITPFAAGRFTVYDDDFEEFEPAGGETDQHRFMGSVGTRVGTQMHRTYNARSDLLNVNDLRHVFEPAVDVFYVGNTLRSEKLPTFDPDIEDLSRGAGTRLGLTNTLQTRRGGEDRWRSVDWITLQTDLVLRSSDADVDAPIPRFYSYRPEFSRGGDHAYGQLRWMLTDVVGATGEAAYNLESDEVAQWRAGARFDHSARLRSYVNYGEIEVFESQLLTYGFDYQATPLYRARFRHRLDFGENEARQIHVTLDRRLPQATLRMFVTHDQLDDEQTVGVVLVPHGARLGHAISPGLFTQ